MKELFWIALLAYIEMLELHLDCKTTDKNLHERTQDFYELLFEISHSVWERFVDLDGELRDDHSNCESQKQDALRILVQFKESLDTLIKSNSLSIWADNLLRWFSDKLDFQIGNAKALTNKVTMKMETKETPDYKEEIKEVISL